MAIDPLSILQGASTVLKGVGAAGGPSGASARNDGNPVSISTLFQNPFQVGDGNSASPTASTNTGPLGVPDSTWSQVLPIMLIIGAVVIAVAVLDRGR